VWNCEDSESNGEMREVAAFLGKDWPVPGEKGERVLLGTPFLFDELE
jgi:hypothetical protein